MKTKKCSKCGVEKPLEYFSADKKKGCGYRAQCKHCVNLYRAANKQKIKENYEINKEKYSSTRRDTYNSNKELRDSTNKVNKEWYAQHKDIVAAQNRCRYLANPEVFKHRAKLRRIRNKNAEGSYTQQDIYSLLISQDRMCVYCSSDIQSSRHDDHIMPLILGGTNWPNNIQILCPTCNLRKQAQLPSVYEQEIGFNREAYEEKYPRPNFGDQ